MDERQDTVLAALLEDAVADVEPTDALAAIRARVRPSRRPWWYAGGALVAAAATVATVAMLGGGSPQRAVDPAGPPTTGVTPSTTPEEDVVAEPPTIFWIGDTPQGPRLFGEQTPVVAGYGVSQLHAVVRTAVTGRPQDPDYRSGWEGFRVRRVQRDADGSVDILLRRESGDPEDRETYAAVQLAWTIWELLDEEVEVSIEATGPLEEEFAGIGIGPPVDPLEVLALVQVDSPTEGEEVSDTFSASGSASSYEATVPWRLEAASGEVVREGFATAEGWMKRFYPWQTEVDVRGLPPGTYTFVASTADPSGGEGPGPTTDTRTVVVR